VSGVVLPGSFLKITIFGCCISGILNFIRIPDVDMVPKFYLNNVKRGFGNELKSNNGNL
jgi:hypothetical protein